MSSIEKGIYILGKFTEPQIFLVSKISIKYSYFLTCPLDVYQLSLWYSQVIRSKIILYSRVHLYNVPPLPADIQIVNVLMQHMIRSAQKLEDMTAVLENPACLVCVNCKAQWPTVTNSDIGILLNWR